MKPTASWPALGLFALALPALAQAQSQPFDHHNLPLDAPDPFSGHQDGIPRMEQVEGACREPEAPLADAASLAALGLTRRQEYIRYFDEANAYLMCLERTKFAFIEEVRRHSNEFHNSP
jgi:hypothetical protein